MTAAATLHAHGITNIETSGDAAKALRPIAGEFASLLFCVGIIGTGLLAIPVLAGSAAYAMSGAFDWDCSLELAPGKAMRFYAIIGVSTLVGAGLCFTPIDPIKALYWNAVTNGVLAVPLMIIMMLMASNRNVVGDIKLSAVLKITGWICTIAMTVAVGLMG